MVRENASLKNKSCIIDTKFLWKGREQKFHLSAHYYERNLEKTSNYSQSTHPVGQVLWKELLEEVI